MTDEFQKTFDGMKNWLTQCPASSWKSDYKFADGELKRITLQLDIVHKKGDDDIDEGQQDLPLEESTTG